MERHDQADKQTTLEGQLEAASARILALETEMRQQRASSDTETRRLRQENTNLSATNLELKRELADKKQQLDEERQRHKQLRVSTSQQVAMLQSSASRYLEMTASWLESTIGDLPEGVWQFFLQTYFEGDCIISAAISKPPFWVKTPWVSEQPKALIARSLAETAALLFRLLHQNNWSITETVTAFDYLHIISTHIMQEAADASGVHRLLPTLVRKFRNRLSGEAFWHDFAILQLSQLAIYISGPAYDRSVVNVGMMIGPDTRLSRVLGRLVEAGSQASPEAVWAAVDKKCSVMIGGSGVYRDRDVDEYWVFMSFEDKSLRIIERSMTGRVRGTTTSWAQVPSPDSERWEDIIITPIDLGRPYHIWIFKIEPLYKGDTQAMAKWIEGEIEKMPEEEQKRFREKQRETRLLLREIHAKQAERGM
ncbi:hypothetical protein PFICI_07615 [Pestalotiopsis fici W106-1]|uniref:Uncharacterized protein n=1 Tax=Pestalotiopsis fici (strain W106-1 / CGMCC3.15140) TaxID=1229662 RepID=W3X4I1_PESFW|nr:uncharacterized protein PFICI_07615 [Pestalotiopsis fici W106-1]ETS80086.1 hypothetical protein PFICI_07615 [Pestalotiopsis fici W106-1]